MSMYEQFYGNVPPWMSKLMEELKRDIHEQRRRFESGRFESEEQFHNERFEDLHKGKWFNSQKRKPNISFYDAAKQMWTMHFVEWKFADGYPRTTINELVKAYQERKKRSAIKWSSGERVGKCLRIKIGATCENKIIYADLIFPQYYKDFQNARDIECVVVNTEHHGK